MENRAHHFVVGLFMLGFIAAIVMFVFWLSRDQFSRETDSYYIYFTDSVTGLTTGSQVRYRGVPIGEVTDIRIMPENLRVIRVTVDVARDTPIKGDSVASLELLNITGGIYVQISGGTQKSPSLRPNPDGTPTFIPSKPSMLSSLRDMGPELLNNMIELTARAKEVVDDTNRERLSKILVNVEELTGGLDEATPHLIDAVEEMRNAMASTSLLVQEFQIQAKDIGNMVQSYGDKLSQEVSKTTVDIRNTSTEMRRIIENNKSSVNDFSQNSLYEFGVLIEDLRILVENMSRMTTLIERSPGEFLFGNSSGGVNLEN